MVIKFIKIHGNKYDYSLVDYIDSKTKIKIICKVHGVFSQLSHNHITGNECPKCHGINMCNEDFILRSNIIHNNLFEYTKCDYKRSLDKVIITCSKHGDFKQRPNDHLGGVGCPICLYSRGELRIKNHLESININNIIQYKFYNCKNIYKLPFDFYLPDHNICIEFDGEQHFKENIYFGGREGFIKRIKNDEIKNKYCLRNNINLLRIKYDQINNIENIIKDYLNKIEKLDIT